MIFRVFVSQVVSLLLEFSIYRFISATQHYRFASVAVGVALLGYGYSWIFVYVKERRGGGGGSVDFFSLFFPPAVALAVFSIYLIKVEPAHFLFTLSEIPRVFALFAFLSFPFGVSGAIIGGAFAHRRGKEFEIYAASMLGAALGALLWLLLARFVQAGNVLTLALLLSTAILPGLASPRIARIAGALIAVSAALFVSFLPYPMSDYKALSQLLNSGSAKILSEVHDIDGDYLLASSKRWHAFPGLSPSYGGSVPPQVFIFKDGDLVGWALEGASAGSEVVEYMLDSLPFLHPGKKLLLIGAGGTLPMNGISSLSRGREAIVVDGRYGLKRLFESSGFLPSSGIDFLAVAPHKYLLRGSEKFDLIYFTDVGTLSYSSVSGRPLGENYWLTVDVMEKTIERLADDGVLAFSGWSKIPLREEAKLVSLLREAAGRNDRGGLARNVIVAYGYSRFVLLAAFPSFREEFVESVERFLRRKGFSAVIEGKSLRGSYEDPRYSDAVGRLISPGGREIGSELFALEPPTFDRPYFFRFLRLSAVGKLREVLGSSWIQLVESGYLTLLLSVLVVTALGLVLVLLPSVVLLLARFPKRGRGFNFRFLALGVLCGAGFTLMEMIFIGRSSFYFDSPAAGFVVVLTLVFCGSGLGSLLGRKVVPGKHFPLITSFLLLFGFPFSVMPGSFFASAWMAGVFGKVAFTVFCFLTAVLLGTYFPQIVGEMESAMGGEGVAVLWGVNNFASVAGSLAAPLLTSSVGFAVSFGIATALYMGFTLLYRGTALQEGHL